VHLLFQRVCAENIWQMLQPRKLRNNKLSCFLSLVRLFHIFITDIPHVHCRCMLIMGSNVRKSKVCDDFISPKLIINIIILQCIRICRTSQYFHMDPYRSPNHPTQSPRKLCHPTHKDGLEFYWKVEVFRDVRHWSL
jgi:hypothetical protein